MKTIPPFQPASVLPSRARRGVPQICAASIASFSARRSFGFAGHAAALAAGLFVLSSPAQATTGTWKAAPADAVWNNNANWSGATFPNAIGESATFNTALSGTIGGAGNPITLSATVTIQSLNFAAGAGAYVIGVNGSTGLILRGANAVGVANSINMAAGVTNSEVVAAPISFNAPSSTSISYEFLNNSTTTAATLTISGAITTNTATNRFTTLVLDGTNAGANTISGVITTSLASGGVQQAVITKNGAGTWILSGANVLSGAGITSTTGTLGIQVNAGVLSVQNNQALGTSATANNLQTWINNGGTLELANSITLDNGVSLNLQSGGTIRSSGSTTTSGRINVSTAATSVTLSTVGAGDVFTIGNGTNDFTGGTAATVTNIAGPGTVFQNVASNYAGTWSINAGTLRLGSATALGAAATAGVAFGASSTGTLQLNGNIVTVASLNTNATVGTPVVENNFAGTATLTVSNTSGTSAYGGVLQNGATGTLALTKAGASTLTLSGNANTYSGATTISAGVLNVTNTTGSATGTSAVALNGGTLTGAGLITGTVTTATAGVITPGTVTAGSAGSGVLTLGNLTLANGTTINYGLNAGSATANYISTGTLMLPGSGTVVLDLYTPGTNTAFAAAGTYDLFQYTTLAGGALSTAFSFGTSIAGFNATFGTASAGGGNSYLTLTLAAAGVIGTWTNGNATGNWNEAGNWSGGIPSNAGDSAVFASAPGTVTLDANKTVGGITFNNASAYTIVGGNTLTLDNSGSGVAIGVNAGAHAIGTAVAFNDNVTVTPAGGTQLSLSGNISQASGTRSLTKTGTGTLVLSGTNTYSGGTSVSAGVLNFNGLNALGAGTTLGLGGATTNGTLQYAGGNTTDVSSLTVTLNAGGGTIDTNGNNVALANAIGNSGAGGLTKAGNGILTLSGANTYSGNTTISGGTVSAGANANLGPAATGAQLTFTGTGSTLATTAGFGLFNGAAGTNDRLIALSGTDGTLAPVAGTTLTVSGAITGLGKLIKADAGQVTILTATFGQNTFSGGTLISAGTILLGDANSTTNGLGTSASNTITLDGGTLSLRYTNNAATQTGNLVNNLVVDNGFTGKLITASRGDVSGSLTGSGTLNVQTDYVRSQFDGNWSAFTGQINVTPNTNGGDFRINNTNGFGTARINLANGVTMYMQVNFGAGGLTNSIGELTGGVTSFLRGGPTGGRVMTWSVGGANTNAQFDGNIQDGGGPTAMTKVGAGSWTLTGTNTYTSTTIIDAGILAIAAGTTGTAAGNILVAPANADTATVTVAAGATLNSALFLIGSNLASTTGGNGTVTQTGGTINSARYFSVGEFGIGAFTMSGGILNVNSATGTNLEVATFAASSGTVTISGASQVNLLNNGGISMGAQGTTGNGTVTQTGGTVTFYSDAGTTVGGTGALALGAVGTGTYTYNLDRGMLIVPAVTHVTGTGVFNFNGGTLKPAGSTATFLQGLTTANVRNGGALVDTNGFDVTVGQDLLHSAIGGDNATDGGLAKTGSGALTLNGANTYTGATTVSVGTLVAGNAAALGTAGAGTTVASGATLDVRANIGAEAISVSGTGVGGNGALVAGAGTGTVGGPVTMTANTSIGGAGMLNVTGSINGAFTLTTVGAGTTTLSGVQTYSTLTTGAGLTNVNSAVGTGSSTINANATTHINASQTLAALNIADGVEVTFGDGLPFVGGAEKFGAPALVPEPGSMGLMLVGALGLLGRRRRS